MAKALVEVIGDSASAVRALEQTSAALGTTGDAAKATAGEFDALAASMARAAAVRADTLFSQASALTALSTSGSASREEAMAAEALAAKKNAAAYKLLGVQATETGASLTRTAGTIGRGLTTYVTVPTAFIGYEAVKQAVDFNQQMLMLKTQAGDATDSIKELSQQVLQLARTSPQGPVQLSEGLFHLVSLGLRGSQAIGTLKEAAIGAGEGLADLQDVSTALGAAVVSGIRGAQNYREALTTLQATAAVGNMRFADFAASVGNILPVAAASGVSLKEMGAAMAVLTDRGMSAEFAATRLRMAIGQMQAPSDAALKAFAQLGINGNELAGMLNQPGGLLKVLDLLHSRIEAVGQTKGYADLLAAFGRSRSGLGIETLVKSLDSPLSSYSQKLDLIEQQQKQFAANQQAYMESPAYKLHVALSNVETDLVQLGQALTPAVTGMAGAISTIANGFSALPGPIKTEMGVIIGLLAVGGPLGLAIKGIGALLGGVRTAFGLLGPSAAAGVAGADTAMTGLKTSAAGAEAEVATLRSSLLGLAGIGLITIPIAVDIIEHLIHDKGMTREGKTLYRDNNTGQYHLFHLGDRGAPEISKARAYEIEGRPDDAAIRRRAEAEDAYYRRHHPHERHSKPQTGPPPPMSTFALPQNLATNLAKAQAGYGNLNKAEEAARQWILRGIREHEFRGKALEQAYNELATLGRQAVASTNKSVAAFRKTVDDDNLLAQARLDLANGELGAERALLNKDRMRLQALLAEASTSEERNIALKQLATVTRMLHTKADQFALSPKLQEEIAQADALAALHGGSGPDARQIQLAREAKAAALKAIHSHELTLQGLIAAWQIVGQENSILAQAKGAIDTYHAVSAAAIADSVKGLDHAQRMALQERIAQAEAHRGYAPNPPGSHHTQHHVRVDVHVKSKDSHIVHVTKTHTRQHHQRAGGRR